jgi:hypothetical protein
MNTAEAAIADQSVKITKRFIKLYESIHEQDESIRKKPQFTMRRQSRN